MVYSPYGCKESDMTGRTHTHEHRGSNKAEEWSQWEETDKSWRESIRVRTHDVYMSGLEINTSQ